MNAKVATKDYGLLGTLLGIVFIGMYATHLIHCFITREWWFLLAGAIYFPIGVAHGLFLWVT